MCGYSRGVMVKNLSYERALAHVVITLCACIAGAFAQPLLAQTSDWSLEPYARAEAGVISAETETDDEEFIVNGDGAYLRGQAGLDYEDDDSRFRLEADRIEVLRFGSGRSNSNRDRITAQFDQDFGEDWALQLRARYYDDLSSVESSNVDELQGSVRIRYQPVREHRFQLRGSWRKREYDNSSDPQTHGDGPRMDAQYRHRFGRYNYLTVDARAERISSDDPRRGYDRESAKISYTQPITRDLRVRPAVEYLHTLFDGRITPAGERREDHLISPEVELHWWPGPWRVEAEAKYINSNSNFASRDRAGYRLTVAVGHVF